MKIGIIGAMDVEVQVLRSQLSHMVVSEKAGMEFYEGNLCGVSAVIVQCGVGKVNAAICTQILADQFLVTHIINTGVAGSLNADLDIGDILISRDAVQHDMMVTALGYQPGEIPGLPKVFVADEHLAGLARAVCERVNPDVSVAVGRVVSGDQFVSDRLTKERLIMMFDGDCAEMEGAAVAQAAYRNHIPFVIIRAISDKADDSAEMDYPVFEQQAAVHSARLVEALAADLALLPENAQKEE